MLIDSRARAAAAEGAEAGERRSLLAGVRTRVLVSFLALLIVSTAASVLVLRQLLLSRIDEQVERELAVDVNSLQELSASGDPRTGKPFAGVKELFDAYMQQTSAPSDGVLVTFISGNRYLSETANPSDAALETSFGTLARTRTPGGGQLETPLGESQFLAVPVSIGATNGVLVVAALTAAARDEVEGAVRVAVGVSLVVLLLASLFIWLAAGRAIAPLHALSRTAKTISETDLSARIPVSGGDEIADLGRTFNGMLDRLEIAFADQKDFLTDVGHELRTPITVIRGHLETLSDSPREREEAIVVIQDELDRMSRYVDDLLLLAKAPRPDFLRLGPIDLDLFTHDLFTKARSLGDRDWRIDGTGVGIVVADPQRITQAVMNLADNAVRHTRDGEPIWLGSSLVGDQARLWVRDEGPGVDPGRSRADLRPLRPLGVQLPAGGGAGLGLSIVRAIADAHGGRVELDSRLGLGSTFTIVLPASPLP